MQNPINPLNENLIYLIDYLCKTLFLIVLKV